jgi:hypothetical protein
MLVLLTLPCGTVAASVPPGSTRSTMLERNAGAFTTPITMDENLYCVAFESRTILRIPGMS